VARSEPYEAPRIRTLRFFMCILRLKVDCLFLRVQYACGIPVNLTTEISQC
jgi:hypothetical protein